MRASWARSAELQMASVTRRSRKPRSMAPRRVCEHADSVSPPVMMSVSIREPLSIVSSCPSVQGDRLVLSRTFAGGTNRASEGINSTNPGSMLVSVTAAQRR